MNYWIIFNFILISNFKRKKAKMGQILCYFNLKLLGGNFIKRVSNLINNHLNDIFFNIKILFGVTMEKKSKPDISKDIWKIWDLIQDLELIKDDIIEYFEIKESLDETTKEIWISDVKEFYYSIIGAWELLSSVSKGNVNHGDSLKGFLYTAKSFLAKSISELEALNEEKASMLILQAKGAFDNCYKPMFNKFKEIIPETKIMANVEQVEKVSENEYNLRCSLCGKVSVVFRLGTWTYTKTESLIYRGITHEVAISLKYAETIFESLEKDDIAKVHSIVDQHPSCEGIDAYCPECDKIYCWDHYNPIQEFDDGFYDCTYGTCPKGHSRMIDD